MIRATGVRYGAEDLIEALAQLEANDGAHVRAAELLGTADGLREALRTPLWGVLLERHEQLIDEVREAAGSAVVEAALERGRAYPLSHWLTIGAAAPLPDR